MRSSKRVLGLTLATLVSFALVAGCGDDESNDAQTTATSASAETVTTAPATEPDQTTIADGPATTEGGASTTPAGASGTAPASGGDADALELLVAAAKEEGSVTLYSIQALDPLNELAAAFKEKYGIEVTVVRGVDADTVRGSKQSWPTTYPAATSSSAPTSCGCRPKRRTVAGWIPQRVPSLPVSVTTTQRSSCTRATTSRSARGRAHLRMEYH